MVAEDPRDIVKVESGFSDNLAVDCKKEKS